MSEAANKIITVDDREKKNFSRDELNLAEFPLTVLSKRSNTNEKTLEFQDTITNKNKQVVQRKWIITGADKFGLPTASDDEVLLGLMKISSDDRFQNRRVFFTRYELLRALHWTTEGRSYTRLQNALDRLTGVRIKAVNAFYDNEAKGYSTKNFGIIDNYEINDGRSSGVKPSFFTWNEEIFQSFQGGFLRKIDLDFYLDLESAVSKRLYRFLGKHFWYSTTWRGNLFTLAHEKVGITRNYKYASSIRQQLDPAIQELIDKGYLSRCEYEGKGKDVDIIFYKAEEGTKRITQVLSSKTKPEQVVEVITEEEVKSNKDILIERLVQRGLQLKQLSALLDNKTEEELTRMQRIVDYYDRLISSNSHLVSRSPVGFLYNAIKTSDTFVLPNDNTTNKKTDSNTGTTRETAKISDLASVKENLEKQYQEERATELAKIKEEMEPEVLENYREQVAKRLESVRCSLSEEHFFEAVEHGVDDKLAETSFFPTFSQWLAKRNG